MTFRKSILVTLCALFALLLAIISGCGKKSKSTSVKGSAKFYSGATTSATSERMNARSLNEITANDTTSLVPHDGNWLITPDTLTVTLTSIQLIGGSGGTLSVNCQVTYDGSQPSLTQLKDCPITVSTGTYTAMNLTFSQTITMTVNDTTNGFYSTKSGIVTTAPTAIGSFTTTLSNTSINNPNVFVTFPQPVTITSDASSAILGVVVNAIQSYKVTVSGGTVALGWSGTNYPDPGLPGMVASMSEFSKIAVYASPALNTAGSYCAGGSCPTPPMGITSISVYYTSATTPALVNFQMNGAQSGCDPTGHYMDSTHGYLGIDSSTVLSWASFNDDNRTKFSTEFRMTAKSTIGQTTDLYCLEISSDPAPQGGSFASGAPNIAVDANKIGTFTLVTQ